MSESIKRKEDTGAVEDNFDNYISISVNAGADENAVQEAPRQISRRELLLNTSQKLQTIFDEETIREKKNSIKRQIYKQRGKVKKCYIDDSSDE